MTLGNGQTLPLGFDEKNGIIRSKLQVTTAPFPINGFTGNAPVQLVFPHHRKAMIADSKTETMAARALVLQVAQQKDAGEPITMEAAAAKYFASETVGRVADRAGPGEIVVARSAGMPPPALAARFHSLGPQTFKNIAEPVECLRLEGT